MLNNASRLFFKKFKGLNSYISAENISSDWWTSALNVAVNANGAAEVLHSPKAFNDIVGSGNPIISMADYLTPSTHKLLFDIQIDESMEPSSGEASESSSDEHGTLATYTINDDFTNKLIRTDQYDYPFISAVVNTKLFRVNQKEFVQVQEDAETFYRVGIDPPVAEPAISYVTGGSGEILDGIQFSYAYHNTTTTHVSQPGPISNRLGPSDVNKKIRIPVVASTEIGVNKIMLFATLDGGAVPYLLIDTNGDPQIFPNTTGNIDISIDDLHWDTLTPEPIFNFVPPLGAQFMFVWKDRVILLNFVSGSAISTSGLAYSGYESTYIGQPGESWPTLNQMFIPARGEILRGGIGTQVGALILSDLDAYLISGYPSDKTSGPEAVTSVTEHLEPLHWQIGTQSARTIKNTPFGTLWLDHAKRLRLWRSEGFPTEIGLPLRLELDKLDETKLDTCEAQWFQMGKNGGYYALVGTIDGNVQRLFIVSLYEDPETGTQQVGFAISDIQGYSLQPVRVFSNIILFLGGIDRTFTIFNPDQAGSGWPISSEIFFEQVVGNEDNFCHWHSIRFDGDIDGLELTVRDFNESVTNGQLVDLSQEDDTGTSWFGLLDTYGRRKILRFSFKKVGIADADLSLRQIKNIQVLYQKKPRSI